MASLGSKYILDQLPKYIARYFSLRYKCYLRIVEASGLWHQHRVAFPLYWTAPVTVA